MISSSEFREAVESSGLVLGPHVRVEHRAGFQSELSLFDAAVVAVSHDQARLGDIGVSVWLRGRPEMALEIADVLRATDCPPDVISRCASMQAVDPSILENVLRRTLENLAHYGPAFLKGDVVAFDEALDLRSRRASAYTHQVNDAPALEAADSAWHRGDLGLVVELLLPLRPRLSERDMRRLDVARRRESKDSSVDDA